MQMSGDEQDEVENGEGAPETGDDAALETEEQLTLAEGDEPLPWLESEEEEEPAGFDWRLLIFALLGLLAVAAILFAVSSFLKSDPDPDMVADGGTIEAPDEPIKTRPEDAGGSEVDGTGDVSFQVGEGQSTEGQLSDGSPSPSIDRNQNSDGAGSAAAGSGSSGFGSAFAGSGSSGSGASASGFGASGSSNAGSSNAGSSNSGSSASGSSANSSGVGIQIGAYSSRATANNGWSEMSGRFSALNGLSHRIIEGTADSGTIYRLQAVASDRAAADSVCRSIKAAGGDCQVKN